MKYFLEKSKNCRHPISTNRRPPSVPLPTCCSSIQKCWVLPFRHSTHTRGAGLTKLAVCGVNIAMNFEYCNIELNCEYCNELENAAPWMFHSYKEGTDNLATNFEWITKEPYGTFYWWTWKWYLTNDKNIWINIRDFDYMLALWNFLSCITIDDTFMGLFWQDIGA